jgi:hypothetical protein
MGDWRRTTRECSFESLQSGMIAAVNKHIEQYNLEDIPSKAIMCIETSSENIRKGIFGSGDETVLTGVLLTPHWLIWAIDGDRSGGVVMSARLAEVVVQDYAETQYAKMVPDDGLEVSGSFTDALEKGSAFIGLDKGVAAQKFKDVVTRAVQDAKK